MTFLFFSFYAPPGRGVVFLTSIFLLTFLFYFSGAICLGFLFSLWDFGIATFEQKRDGTLRGGAPRSALVSRTRAVCCFRGLMPILKRPRAVASSSPSPSGLVPTSRTAHGALRKNTI